MPNEDLLSEKLLQPMVQLSYATAMDLVQARLRMINADLTEQCHRQVIRNMSCRIKTPDSLIDKQSDSVDVVSGATYSSKGIMNAVKDALSK